MGYFTITQQIGFFAALPVFLLVFTIANLFPAAPGGNILASDLFWRSSFTIAPSLVFWLWMAFDGFKRAYAPLSELIILISQVVVMGLSIFLVVSLPQETSMTNVRSRKIHAKRFLIPMSILFLGTVGILIKHILAQKGNYHIGENSKVAYDANPCETNPNDSYLPCKVSKMDKSTKDYVCQVSPDSQKCKDFNKPEEPPQNPETTTEGFDGTNVITNINDTNVYRMENTSLYQRNPALITDPRLNIEFDDSFTPDASMEDFFRHNQDTQRTQDLIFGKKIS